MNWWSQFAACKKLQNNGFVVHFCAGWVILCKEKQVQNRSGQGWGLPEMSASGLLWWVNGSVSVGHWITFTSLLSHQFWAQSSRAMFVMMIGWKIGFQQKEPMPVCAHIKWKCVLLSWWLGLAKCAGFDDWQIHDNECCRLSNQVVWFLQSASDGFDSQANVEKVNKSICLFSKVDVVGLFQHRPMMHSETKEKRWFQLWLLCGPTNQTNVETATSTFFARQWSSWPRLHGLLVAAWFCVSCARWENTQKNILTEHGGSLTQMQTIQSAKRISNEIG